jgi:hypothetical protein
VQNAKLELLVENQGVNKVDTFSTHGSQAHMDKLYGDGRYQKFLYPLVM